jgi:outer membrane protein
MNHKKLVIILAALLVPGFVAAQSKIGVVNANRVVQDCQKGKAFFESMDADNKAKRSEIEGMVKKLQDTQKEANAKAASMSEDKRKETALELQKMETDIKRFQEDAEREAKLKLNTGLEKFQRELGPLIRQIALEKGLDLVLNDGQASGIVFRSDSIDITDDVIKKYDEMNQ